MRADPFDLVSASCSLPSSAPACPNPPFRRLKVDTNPSETARAQAGGTRPQERASERVAKERESE